MPKKVTQITDIVSVRTLQKIQDKFAEVLDFSLVIYDLKGRRITKTSNVNRFWKEFIEDNPTLSPSDKDDITKAIEEAVKTKETYIFNCYCNATSFAVPINVNDRTIAVFIGGRIRTKNPDLKVCHEESEKNSFDFDSFLESYLGLPLFNEQEINGITKLLKTIANTISLLSLSDTQSKEKVEEVSYLNKLLEEEIEIKNIALEKSEKKYRSLVENALDIICTIDASGLMTSINEIGTKYINMPREDIIGSHYSRYIHPKDLSNIKNAIEKVKNGESDTILNLSYKGLISEHEFSINGKAIRDSHGNLLEIECIIRDTTKEKKLQEDLQRAKEEYQELFNAVPDGIYACDIEGRFLKVNKAACEILGYSEEELIGKHVKDMYVDPVDRTEYLEYILKNGYYHGFVAHLKHKSGKTFYVETYSSLIKDKNGAPVAIEGVFRDITTRVKLSEQVQASEKKFKNIFENNFDAIIVTNEKGDILEFNKKAERLLGKELKIKNLKNILQEDSEIIIKNALKREYFEIPTYAISKNNSIHYVSIGASKLSLDKETLFQIIFHDIKTEIHKRPQDIRLPRTESVKSV